MSQARRDLIFAINDVLATANGKRVIFWMLEQAGVYRDAYTGEGSATNYTLGQQSMGRRLIALLDEIDPQIYPKLLLEIADQRQANEQSNSDISEEEENS